MVIKYVDFKHLVSLVRTGTPIEVNGVTYVAKKVNGVNELGCCHCSLSKICQGDIVNVCMALDTPSQSYYLERYVDED